MYNLVIENEPNDAHGIIIHNLKLQDIFSIIDELEEHDSFHYEIINLDLLKPRNE